MIGDKRLLAIIPARGGSKRLPGKNILEFAGKPLIARTIEAALGSRFIDSVVVSTDNEEISQVSKQYGANVPFLRPEELATDEATTVDAVLHTILFLKDQADQYEFVVLLQPTSPLRSARHIDGAVEVLMQRNADAVVSVAEVDHPVEWTNVLPEDGCMAGFLSDLEGDCRSQDLPVRYRLNGAIYLISIPILLAEGTFVGSQNSYAYKMNKKFSVDIDDDVDFKLATLLFQVMNEND